MMILYQADRTQFLQEFKVFSHLGVCVLVLVTVKTYTHGRSHSDSQTRGSPVQAQLTSFLSPMSSAPGPGGTLDPHSVISTLQKLPLLSSHCLLGHCRHRSFCDRCAPVTAREALVSRILKSRGARLDGPN